MLIYHVWQAQNRKSVFIMNALTGKNSLANRFSEIWKWVMVKYGSKLWFFLDEGLYRVLHFIINDFPKKNICKLKKKVESFWALHGWHEKDENVKSHLHCLYDFFLSNWNILSLFLNLLMWIFLQIIIIHFKRSHFFFFQIRRLQMYDIGFTTYIRITFKWLTHIHTLKYLLWMPLFNEINSLLQVSLIWFHVSIIH